MAEGGGGLEAEALVSARSCRVADSASLEGSDEGGGGVRVLLVTAVMLDCS
jgi:hypothetical protein